jgi:hypothetical protein
MYFAAKRGLAGVVTELLNHGATLCASRRGAKNALTVAHVHGNDTVVATILARAPTIELPDDNLDLFDPDLCDQIAEIAKNDRAALAAYANGTHEQLGAGSPVLLLNGHEHIFRFVCSLARVVGSYTDSVHRVSGIKLGDMSLC